MKSIKHSAPAQTPLEPFTCKVVGTTFEGREKLLPMRKIGEKLCLVREPENAFDPGAIAIYSVDGQIGYIGKTMAHLLAPHMDAGEKWSAAITNVLGGAGLSNLGIELSVYSEEAEPQCVPDHFGETV